MSLVYVLQDRALGERDTFDGDLRVFAEGPGGHMQGHIPARQSQLTALERGDRADDGIR